MVLVAAAGYVVLAGAVVVANFIGLELSQVPSTTIALTGSIPRGVIQTGNELSQ